MTAALQLQPELEDSDTDLVAQAVQGNSQAFRQLFDRHYRRIYALVWRLAGDHDSAHDVTQEVFIKVWRSLTSFRGESKFSTWLHTVATRVAISELRKQKRWQQGLVLTDDPTYSEQLASAQSTDVSLLDRLILRLPVQMRWVFVLHCIEGLRHEEVAQELGIAVGTSKTQVHRARALLEEWLSDDTTNNS